MLVYRSVKTEGWIYKKGSLETGFPIVEDTQPTKDVPNRTCPNVEHVHTQPFCFGGNAQLHVAIFTLQVGHPQLHGLNKSPRNLPWKKKQVLKGPPPEMHIAKASFFERKNIDSRTHLWANMQVFCR